ncbi:transposase [Arthrobacter sp. 1088]|nr:transposase [Arthrobacter sp. 1088]MDR6688243.1 transposase [Arthrobacter sp. 1088]
MKLNAIEKRYGHDPHDPPLPASLQAASTPTDILITPRSWTTSVATSATGEFPTTPAGYQALSAWLNRRGQLERVGIEGTGTYGAGLTRHLEEAGVKVVEVNRPDRSARRAKGKSDPLDAYAAARAALSGTAEGQPKTERED